jgi:outer membrane protein
MRVPNHSSGTPMLTLPYRKSLLILCFSATGMVAATVSASAAAAGLSGEVAPASDDGFTFLSDAPNVTHWGIGAGVGYRESPYKGYGADVSPLPVLFFDNKWIHAFGTMLDLKVGSWNGVSLTLRGQYALGAGYKGSDAPILNGMQTRKGAILFGPALRWDSSLGVVSASFMTGGNKGQQAHVDFSKAFDVGPVQVVPHAGVDWSSSKYVDYYYGVTAAEANADRPAYQGKSAVDVSIGTRIDYRLSQHQTLSLDVGVRHYGSGITDSPLVGKKTVPEARFAYVYQFR